MTSVTINDSYTPPFQWAGHPQQAYLVDGTLYAFGQATLRDESDQMRLDAFTSTDNGATWAPVDGEHAPKTAFGMAYGIVRSGNTVYVSHAPLYQVPTIDGSLLDRDGEIFVTPFDLVAGTWGTASSDGTVASRLDIGLSTYTAPQFAAVRPSGELVLVYYYAATTTWRYVALNAGTWSAPTDISELADVWPAGIVSDADGNVHIVGSNGDGDILYLALRDDNTVSSAQTIATQTFTPSGGFQPVAGIVSNPVLDADGLVHFTFGLATADTELALSHASADPTLTVTVDAIPGTTAYFRGLPGNKPLSIHSSASGTWDAYYCTGLHAIYKTSWGGAAWSSPALFVDESSDEAARDIWQIYSGADVGIVAGRQSPNDLAYYAPLPEISAARYYPGVWAL